MFEYLVRCSDVNCLQTNSKTRALLEIIKMYITEKDFDVLQLVKNGRYVVLSIDGMLKK